MRQLSLLFFAGCLCCITCAQWNGQFDYDDNGVIGFGDFSLFSSHWGQLSPELEPAGMEWVQVNDQGVSGHEGFDGQMSKYEITNAQYCRFLNTAIASGDIFVDGDYVKGASGSNIGEDFPGLIYYRLDGPGDGYNGVPNGGAAMLNYNGGSFTVDSGFESHPVTYVSWCGAAAFCDYYGWDLPTEWQWQAVADYDGSYIYGCGTSINHSIANYYDSVHPYGTTAVGTFGTYGYGVADMAGNVWEWTGTVYPGNLCAIRGGGWGSYPDNCTVSYRHSGSMDVGYIRIGFRACRFAWPVWDSKFDHNNDGVIGIDDFMMFISHWGEIEPVSFDPDITWVSISDPGVVGHEGFTGQMSKYETTNAQYCLFLNDAIATGDITVEGFYIRGANGSNTGADFIGRNYYVLQGTGYSGDGVSNGGAPMINYSDGVFTVDSGFEDHPVTYVSLFGAMAFCNYYGWRLPTEWEWQAVADYNGSFTYGCGTGINNSVVNYLGSVHPYGTTPVGAFGAYGYGMADMSGNVWEWTTSLFYPAYSSYTYRTIRGGCWYNIDYFCPTAYRTYDDPYDMLYQVGFRVCR